MRRTLRNVGLGLGVALALRAIVRGAQAARYRLGGRVVLITGGSRGLGLVLARAFGRAGAKLVITARDAEELARARDELKRAGIDVLAHPCDVGDPASVRDLVTLALDWFGGIDVLVNNAGIIEVGPMETMAAEDYEAAMRTHFWGPLDMIREIVPLMRARGEGRIVNVSSIGGVVAVPHLLPYSASKFALTGLSEGLRAELAKSGVKVTTVVPGLMRTGSPRNAWFKGNARAEYAWFATSASLHATSMSAERAAARIVRACRRGEAHVVLSLPAKLAAIAHGLFPGVTAHLMALANRALPAATGDQTASVRGAEARGDSPALGMLTASNERAAARNNEVRARP